MILLNAHQLSFSLPGRSLLEDVDLSLEKGDKVGLIGRNGSGKSTLMKLLNRELQPDSGTITVRGQTSVQFLDQLPSLEHEIGLPLEEVVARGSAELLALRDSYESVCEKLETLSGQERTAAEDRLNDLTDKLTQTGAWDLETRANTLLTTLGFPDSTRTLEHLSGGEMKRVAMARTLLVPPDILMLDEPTNHLDIATIAWLEEFLRKASFTVLMVTHDRFFLERVCNRIVEVSGRTLHSFSGNYSKYLELKAEREVMAQKQQERFQNTLRQEMAWLSKDPKARATKQKARIQRVNSMLEQGVGRGGPTDMDSAAWDLGTTRLGKKVVGLEDVSFQILKNITFRLEPGERIGLVGANGSGKTTFLRLLTGEIEPDSGHVDFGETVVCGHFDQHSNRLSHLPENTRVLDAIKDVAHTVPTGGGKELTAGRLCEMFLFTGSSQATPISKLSGGERKRLELLRLLMARPNLFLADEPTNDLDIETLQLLETFFDHFPGCVCIASHDRFLLQRLCDRILIFRDGVIEEALSSVLDHVSPDFFEKGPTVVGEVPSAKVQTKPAAPAVEKVKLTYKQKSELEALDKNIPIWEEKLKALEAELAEKANDYKAVKELFSEKEALEKTLEDGFERWSELGELKEKAQS